MTDEQEKNAEVGFAEWFYGDYGIFSSRSEVFYTDCEIENEKIRKDLVYSWVHAAYMCGYAAKIIEELEETK